MEGRGRHGVKLHGYLDELMKMTPRNVIYWHPREHLHLVCAEGILRSRHLNSSVIPDARRPGVNLFLLLLPNP